MAKKPAAAKPKPPQAKKKGDTMDKALSDAKGSTDKLKAAGLKPIGEALKPLADEAAAKGRVETAPRPSAETSVDKLAATPRTPTPERGDPIDPIVIRGPNVDTVNGFKTTNKDQLQTLARQYRSMKDAQSTKSGEISDFLTKAEETKSLDKWAFREAMKWKKMSDELKVRRLPIFMKYLDDLGVVDDATKQGDMLAADAEERAKKAQTDSEDEAAKAAKGLAPGKKPTMTIVPKDPPPAEPTADSVFKPLH